MSRNLICKLLQRKTYDVLTKKYIILVLFAGVVIVIVSILHFGETMMEWSKGKYSTVFQPFMNNIAGKSFQDMLCQPLPVDVVYTWVNGTDPNHLAGLALTKRAYGFSQPYTNSCKLALCFESHIVFLKPGLSKYVTLDDLKEISPEFENIVETFAVNLPNMNHINITALVFPSVATASQAAKKDFLMLKSVNYSLTHAVITNNWFSQGTMRLENVFIIYDLAVNLSEEFVLMNFPLDVRDTIIKVRLHSPKHYAILSVSNSQYMNRFITSNNTFKNSLSIISANLLVEHPLDHEDISASRFTDNEELRYSLRSLEKHAPWVQNIFIVTNGQIPYWLNLDNPRVTIVTHEEIFLNKSYLPTYSSPAIECNLHRIPNLSKQFLYLNDDVMFGKDVWPEDFYTQTKGHKVYLSWPVPNCAEGCPPSWIRDGYCDKPCNNSLCQWDGGDCHLDNPLLSYQGVVIHQDGPSNIFKMAASQNNCNQECVNSWLADRYCDKPCNVPACGFDAGDCGIDRYNQLTEMQLSERVAAYHLPEGEQIGFFNLTSFIHNNHTITNAFYDNNPAVRMLAVSLKYSVLTVVLYPDQNATKIDITFKGKRHEAPFEKTFLLHTNTKRKTSKPLPELSVTEESFTFEEFLNDVKFPQILPANESEEINYAMVDVLASNLTGRIAFQLEHLAGRARNGELTEKGFWRTRSNLVKTYAFDYYSKYQAWPMLLYDENLDFDSIVNSSAVAKPDAPPASNSSVIDANSTLSLRQLLQYSENDLHVEENNQKSGGKIRIRGFEKELPFIINSKNETVYFTPSVKKRHLLDTFGDSLRHVNKIYNEAFGYVARKVPSHIAHFVDRDVMDRLYKRFHYAFDETSSHRIRRPNDMQFAFSYYYYLMSEIQIVELGDLFDMFDVDQSGTWSDREIRTVLTRLNDLPLDFSEVTEFHQNIINCSSVQKTESPPISTPHYERYYESNLPIVTKDLVLSCKPICDILKQQFGEKKQNDFEIVGEDEVAFKMIHNNLSHVLSQIDDIRKNPKKFVCLNDNMKHGTPEADVVRTVIQDFYESLFPARSQFELPPEYRNRFLCMDEFKQWRKMRDFVRWATYLSLFLLIVFTVTSFWKSEVKPRTGRRFLRKSPEKLNVV